MQAAAVRGVTAVAKVAFGISHLPPERDVRRPYSGRGRAYSPLATLGVAGGVWSIR